MRSTDLSWQTIRDGVEVSFLPRRMVQESGFTRGAVLSWRWDRDLFEGRSRNIALALHHAMRTEIEWLFLDLVTVDQSLSSEELLEKVSALATLYEKVPVFVAGDRPDVPQSEWARTFRRPWLLYEARSYAVNPAGVTYLGYRHRLSSEVAPVAFAPELQAIREAGFAIYVFYAIWGYIGMQDPGDFRFILRPFYSLFTYLHVEIDQGRFPLFCVSRLRDPRANADSRRLGRTVRQWLSNKLPRHPLRIAVLRPVFDWQTRICALL